MRDQVVRSEDPGTGGGKYSETCALIRLSSSPDVPYLRSLRSRSLRCPPGWIHYRLGLGLPRLGKVQSHPEDLVQ